MKSPIQSFRALRSALFAIALLLFLACQKTGIHNDDLNPQAAAAKFYDKSEQLNPILTGLVKSFQNQSEFNSHLPEFIKKNGIPVWNKTIYKIGGSNTRVSSTSRTNAVGSKNNGGGTADSSKGFFLVPLQSISTGNIQSYIAVSKHDDINYTYRLYNKDSLDRLHPKSDSARVGLRTLEAIFGVFEKSINNKDSIAAQGGFIKNASIDFDGNQQLNSLKPNQVRVNTDFCLITVTMTVYYEWQYYVDSYLYEGTYVPVAISIQIDIYCWSTYGGGGGTTGTNSGGDPNWWQYGTGWPWNNPSLYGNNDPWNYWWSNYSVPSGVPSGGPGVGSFTEIYPDPTILGNFDDGDNTFRDDNNTTITFDANTDAWPTISSVLSRAQFVPYDYRNCLVLAQEQIGKANVTDLGYGSAFKTYTEQAGVNATEAKSGVEYIISKLRNGKPVMVAVDNRPGTPSTSNNDGSTDHFITIVGAGSDAGGNYFTFFDNATNNEGKGTSTANKLYYNAQTGMISGHSDANGAPPVYHDYIVTQIRKNS
jgi:hypothetical protein